MPPKEPNPILKLFVEVEKMTAALPKREEVVESMRKVLELVKETEISLGKEIVSNKKEAQTALSTLRNDLKSLESSVSTMLAQLDSSQSSSLSTAIETLNSKIEAIQKQIPELPDYTDRFEGIESRLSEIRPDTAEEIRNKLELFVEEDEKLKIEAIGYLREELDELKKIRTSEGGGNGLTFREMVTKYDLSPHLDGATKTFNIPGTYAILSVACSSFPSVLRPTIDYTHTQSTITFTSEIEASTTLAQGQTVIIMLINA